MFLLQDRDDIIHALKEENDRLLIKVRCIEDTEPPFYDDSATTKN